METRSWLYGAMEDWYTALLKFIYSEKATKFCEISTVDLSYVVTVKFTVEISQKRSVNLEKKNLVFSIFPKNVRRPRKSYPETSQDNFFLYFFDATLGFTSDFCNI